MILKIQKENFQQLPFSSNKSPFRKVTAKNREKTQYLTNKSFFKQNHKFSNCERKFRKEFSEYNFSEGFLYILIGRSKNDSLESLKVFVTHNQ